jgi:hypothetical protein
MNKKAVNPISGGSLDMTPLYGIFVIIALEQRFLTFFFSRTPKQKKENSRTP